MVRFILLSLTLLWAATGHATPNEEADPTARIEELAQQASARYTAGAYVDAVELYLEAYRLGNAAALLYNIAVIYDRKIKDPELAISYYRRYVQAPDADPSAARRATQRIQSLKTEQAKADAERREAELAAARKRMAPPPEAPTPPAVAATVQPAEADTTLGWIVTGVGVVAAGVGVGLGVAAGSDQDAFDGSTDLNEKKSLRDSGQQKALLADVLMGVGAAAVITGIVLVVIAEPEPPAVSMTPTADGRGGAVMWGGRF